MVILDNGSRSHCGCVHGIGSSPIYHPKTYRVQNHFITRNILYIPLKKGMKKYCNYCKKDFNFENHHQWMAHRSNCDFNPNKKIKIEKLKNYHKTQIKTFKINCKKCNKEIILNITQLAFNKEKHKKYCSRKCANSHVVSKETKMKISISQKSSEKSKIINENRSEKSNEKRNCEYCNKTFICKKWSKKRYCSSKCSSLKNREKISKLVKEQYKNGKKIYGGKTKWYSVETSNGLIRVQGTYEVRTCKILDKLKKISEIKNWEYTNDRFQYISINKKVCNYLIDFKIFRNDNTFYYLEIKGFKTDNDDLKWNSVKKLGFELIIWFNGDIINNESKYGLVAPM